MPTRSIKLVLSTLMLFCSVAMLVACQPAQAPDTSARTGPVAPREGVVPLVRPFPLTAMAEPLVLEFELPPPGPNSSSTLMIGLRLTGADEAAAAAVARMVAESGLQAELELTHTESGKPIAVPLVRRESRGHGPSELVQVGADGRVPRAVQTTVDQIAVEQAGISSAASSSRSLAFAWARDARPGSYALRLKLLNPQPDLASIDAELLLAYQYRAK
ncbi:hypothetical protein CXG43_09775 [Stenotrophomonas sp. Bg11-02]|nr:hypothetical protein CXG43_09775 [Stenotrophomonas sp. Bg11-02]